jgi:hypothetical protein
MSIGVIVDVYAVMPNRQYSVKKIRELAPHAFSPADLAKDRIDAPSSNNQTVKSRL